MKSKGKGKAWPSTSVIAEVFIGMTYLTSHPPKYYPRGNSLGCAPSYRYWSAFRAKGVSKALCNGKAVLIYEDEDAEGTEGETNKPLKRKIGGL